jgi:hypothetical protein
MLERFRRRKKTVENQQPIKTTSGANIEPVEVADMSQVTDIDVIVSKYMGLDYPKPFSTDRSLVNDMVKFAREKGVKLPLFTSDPLKIATAVANHSPEWRKTLEENN